MIRKKQLHSKNSKSAKLIRYCPGNAFSLSQLSCAHVMGLPGFHIIAVLLDMADGRTEYCSADRTYSQECDFTFKSDKSFHDHPCSCGACTFKRCVPAALRILWFPADTLPFA
ncbi:hypothetical protein D3C74_361150 [compost metagenome]